MNVGIAFIFIRHFFFCVNKYFNFDFNNEIINSINYTSNYY